jgi:hypothetical protein
MTSGESSTSDPRPYVQFGDAGWKWDFRKDSDETENVSANRTNSYARHHPDFNTEDYLDSIHRKIRDSYIEVYPAQNVVKGDLHQIVDMRNSIWDIPYTSMKIAEAPEFNHFTDTNE